MFMAAVLAIECTGLAVPAKRLRRVKWCHFLWRVVENVAMPHPFPSPAKRKMGHLVLTARV
jgi:hypothetical protein